MTSDAPISRFPIPDLDELPDDIRERILTVQEKSGFIPNVFLALAHRPEEFRAFFAYHDALMHRPGNLTKAEREMIVVTTSSLNQCQYCVVAHGAIVRIRTKDPRLSDRRANYRKADISDRQKAMQFAVRVSQGLTWSAMRTSLSFGPTALRTMMCGTSCRLLRSSRCRIASPT